MEFFIVGIAKLVCSGWQGHSLYGGLRYFR